MRVILPYWIIAALLLVGCAGTGKNAGTPEKAAPVAAMSGNGVLLPLSIEDSLLLLHGAPNKDIAQESFLRALMLMNLGKNELAEPYLKRAVAHEPGNRYLAFELVSILVENGRAKEALSIAQRAGTFPGALTAEEAFLLAHLYRENGILDSCIAFYEKTIELSPTHFRALYEYSVVLELMQDYKNLARIYGLLLPLINYPKPMVDKEVMLLKMKSGGDSLLVDFLTNAYQAKGDAELGRELVDILMERKRFDEAYDVVQSLVQSDSADVEVWKLRVRLCARKGDIDGAIQSQAQVFAKDTTQLDELERLAMIEFETGKVDSSHVHFNALLARRPGDHLAWFYQSNLAQIKNDTVGAFDAIQKAVALKPDALAYRNQLASLYARKGDFTKAHQVMDDALVLHPDSPLALQFKGDLYIREAWRIEAKWPAAGSSQALAARDLRTKALPWLSKAWMMDTLATDILFDLAADYERLDSLDAARSRFERLLRIEPSNHQAQNYLGYMLLDSKKDVARGIALIDSAVLQDPNNVAYLDSKGWSLASQGKWKEALEVFNYLAQQPEGEDVVIWEHHALVCEALQDKACALEAWKRLLKLNPHHVKALERVKALGSP